MLDVAVWHLACGATQFVANSYVLMFTQVAKFEDFTAWHCERGSETVLGTNIQYINFIALNNQRSGMEMVQMSGGNRVGESPGEW